MQANQNNKELSFNSLKLEGPIIYTGKTYYLNLNEENYSNRKNVIPFLGTFINLEGPIIYTGETYYLNLEENGKTGGIDNNTYNKKGTTLQKEEFITERFFFI